MDKNAPTNTMNQETIGRILFIVVLLLATAGLGVSIELTDIHHATHTDPDYVSVCAVNDKVNCETVARSPYSVFLGAPVSVWGILGYSIIILFALWGAALKRLNPRYPLGIIFGLTLCAVGASSALAYISFTKIDSLCLFCMSLYGINTILLLTLTGSFIRKKINPFLLVFEDLRALFQKPLILFGLAVPTLAATIAVMTAIEPYWQHGGWKELQLPGLAMGDDTNGHHWIGAKDPILTIVEYSDYQCPFCRKAHKNLRIMAAKYPDEVRVIHRHLPLDMACNKEIKHPFHSEACRFAKAAECAADQNRFWAMNDAIFSIQDTNEVKAADVDVERLAVELGLDRSTFLDCMKSPDMPKRVEEDMKAAQKLGIQGTPTFFIGAQPFEGRIPPVTFKSLLERARKENPSH